MKQALVVSALLNGILLVVLAVVGYLFVSHKIIPAPKPVVKEKQAVSSLVINKSWDLPATSSANAAQITFVISKVQKTDKIVSDGKSYTTKNNKSFLIVNTITQTKSASPVQIAPSDFVKLLVDDKETDPLYKALPSSVDASKSYDSSMVFLINENQSSFVLTIGTNVNKTTTLPLSF